jgi:hypothetical protein
MEEQYCDPGELGRFLNRLRTGEAEFYSRHQEEEWGCRSGEEGGFIVWSRNTLENRDDVTAITEAQARQLFSRYTVDTLRRGLIPVTHAGQRDGESEHYPPG